MPGETKEYRPFVPPTMKMREFTLRAILLGLVMTVILGAANAYLGLRAGMTIAATYPAAVIGMAVLRLMKGSILEENIARTVGSIGESVAAGAVFTIPAFVITKAWPEFDSSTAYWQSFALMLVGGVLGILFVTLLRRVMVEDPDLPFPESAAAAEIHKAGQLGSSAARTLFQSMGIGGLIYLLGEFNLFSASRDFFVKIGTVGKGVVKLSADRLIAVGGTTTASLPAISPAYLGVGYIIGPRLGALNFAGGVVAWGLLVPLIVYFLGPAAANNAPNGVVDWAVLTLQVWRNIVRPIAVGGMLVGASYTLFKMRASLATGIGRAIRDLKQASSQSEAHDRTQLDLNGRTVFLGLGIAFAAMIALYFLFTHDSLAAGVAAVVMIILGFFFAAISGNLVGTIGSSNNPISGLTLCTLIIAALLMVAIGVKGTTGVLAVLGVAAVICVSSAVAGEMLQDLKVGHLLGGTPKLMQMGDFLGVLAASAALYFPLLWLHQANIKEGGIGFGDAKLSAPQAGLMASLSQGIVGGGMPWALVLVGICMGLALIMVQVKSPMLFSVGMYLPLETTFAIFVGGLIRWLCDVVRDRKDYNDAQKARIENAGVLCASGLIAGEALMGLVKAGVVMGTGKKVIDIVISDAWLRHISTRLPLLQTRLCFFDEPPLVIGLAVLVLLALYLIFLPISRAGDPNEPAPPAAIM